MLDSFRLTIRNVNIAMVATLGWYIQSFRLTIRNVNSQAWKDIPFEFIVLD